MLLQNWWFTTLIGTKRPIQPPLRGDVSCDVLIVGGGAAGLAAAARFVGTGKKVVLLERNICGGSSTGKSAGFLTPDSELELSQLVRRFGAQGAKDLWKVPVRGVQRMLELVQEGVIECDLQRQDSLFLGKGSGGVKAVKEEDSSRRGLGYVPGLLPERAPGHNRQPRVHRSRQVQGHLRHQWPPLRPGAVSDVA